MFSGIIQQTGTIQSIKTSDVSGGKNITVFARNFFKDIKTGESVNIDGVCLTVIAHDRDTAIFEMMPETVRITTLGGLVTGSTVNLETSLRYGDPVGGHLVLGHVDGVAKLESIHKDSDFVRMRFAIPKKFSRFLTYKGTIAFNGVSLTVAESDSTGCVIALISHTLEVTNLSKLQKGDYVNFEVDSMARYLESLLSSYTIKKQV